MRLERSKGCSPASPGSSECRGGVTSPARTDELHMRNSTPTTELKTLIASLDAMGVDALRETWRSLIGDPPPVRAGDILRRALADELQARNHGRDAELQKLLNLMASRHKPGRKPGLEAARYRKGAVITRDWNGERHTVMVVDGGFVWRGETHASLSAIARAITGTRWNGPRFFGLRGGV